MDLLEGGVKAISWTADATTSAAGAVGGAAVNGVLGGMQGVVSGVRSGLSSGSHSTPAAALTLAAIGATGVVDWPVLLGVGGTALVIRKLISHPDQRHASATDVPAARDEQQAPGERSALPSDDKGKTTAGDTATGSRHATSKA
ncbi:hypothetical protein C8258_00935 [Nocardia sp. MDA0666]|uniref:hypothetical protein n=1 Tax=Nocardia sp. MDA0666 TaxID=2135448 RepID=UPI000D137727|nr:hypothetical protein [Nocardia sp. MDA0666]PSR69682.1 hypothetical protein C8258_00935 [Nocardia sp. MDA0666]